MSHMTNPQISKNFLQHISSVFSYICFVFAIICLFILMIYFIDLSKVYRASFTASIFFFVMTGFVLREMAKIDSPSKT